ncbi:MAG: VTT domain-containing protein [Gemmatimonadetes bacterium]|nr:VTT domain-containing protein [Gemmatimonadota bacterium]
MGIGELLDYLRDPTALITAVGTVGITTIVFVETGLLFPFLPGDSLLVTAGLLASKADGPIQLNVVTLGILCTIASVVGNQVSFFIGRRTGQALYSRPDSRWFKRKHIEQAQAYYDRHGGKTIVIARFMPIIRTFAPVVAGMADMKPATFLFYNIVGGVAWVWSMLLIGYVLATQFPIVGEHIEGLIVVIVALSLMPAGIAWLKQRQKRVDG